MKKRKKSLNKFCLVAGFFALLLIGGVYARQNRDSDIQRSFLDGYSMCFGVHVEGREEVAEPKEADQNIEEFGRSLFKTDWDSFKKIIQCESSFNPEAVSHTNDYGLSQINSIHGIRSDWLKDPYINLTVAYKLWKEQGAGPWRASYHCHGVI